MTYDEVKAMVADYLNRDDLTTQIPNFIQLAQRRIERGGEYVVGGKTVLIRGYFDAMKTRRYTTTDDYLITLPSDYFAPISMFVLIDGAYHPVTYKTPEEIWTNYPDPTNHVGVPKEFTVLIGENQIVTRPTPDQEYTFDFQYFKNVTVLSDGADTNWWSINAWELLVYGALLEAQPFLMNDERLGTWLALFAGSLDALENRDERAKAGTTPLCVKPYMTDGDE